MQDRPNATPDEIAVLVRLAGLTLTEPQFDELLDAYTHVEAMLARLRRPRAFADEPAHVFRPERFIPTDAA